MYNLNIAIAALYAEVVVCIVYNIDKKLLDWFPGIFRTRRTFKNTPNHRALG